MNAVRATYLALFFANSIFATLFKSLGEETLQQFGTFRDCDRSKNDSCRGNQMIFRASFSIAVFFAIHTVLCRFYRPHRQCRAFLVLVVLEVPVYVGMLVGSFFIPTQFFNGYARFARVVSGFFILFQVASIVDFSYQMRDALLDRVEESTKQQQEQPGHKTRFWSAIWKTSFLGFCFFALIGAGAGVGYLYHKYGSCDVGVGFTTLTVIFIALFLGICISTWLNVGLLPPCVIAVYLVLMCWQALTSNPHKSCEQAYAEAKTTESSSGIIYNAIIGAFSMTWTSWRTSSAASNMFNKDAADATASATRRKSTQPASATLQNEVSAAAAGNFAAGKTGTAAKPAQGRLESETPPEPWQFYLMMFLAGVYMAMALTDWDSSDRSSNGISMWVKIIAQWFTMLLFLWTLVAPKIFPNRDFD